MAKEIPYFRFTATEWLQDDISLESYEHKGFFIDFCSYYWFSDCNMPYKKAIKRFKNAKSLLDDLIESEIIKNDNEILKISFLDVQYHKTVELMEKRAKAGKKGGLAKAKQTSSKTLANAKQMPIYKDKDKEKEKEKEKEKDKDNDKEQTLDEWKEEYFSRFSESTLNSTCEDLP
jgi:hypothetical protein